MAATSPFEQNDYQAIDNLKPYRLPVNDAFNALVSQNEFWEIGARSIKSVYDNALGLKLTNPENQRIRDEFMRSSEVELTKLSRMDVSKGETIRKGQAIFRNLFKDEGIAYDNAMTNHYEKVRQDALVMREKDGGKGYSDTNLAYAMDGYGEFVNSKDRMAGKKLYQNRKEYTPYYDPTSELASIMKLCKASTGSSEVLEGYWIKGYSNESLTAKKVNTCLDGGLSDRAKRQLQINGYVTYKNNPEALRDKYIPHLQGTTAQLSEENAAIKGVLANKNNLKSLKKEDLMKIGLSDPSQVTPELIQSLEQTVNLNDKRMVNINASINKMLAGDLSDITSNFEPIAGAMYSRDYIQNIAEGLSYDFSKNTVKADPVQMMFYQQNQINARQEDQQLHDIEMKDLDLRNDLAVKQMKSGNLKGLFGGGGPEGLIDAARLPTEADHPFSSIDKADSYDQVTKKRQEIANQRTTVDGWLLQRLKEQEVPLDASVTSANDARFKNYWANFQVTAAGDPEKKKIVDKYYSEMGRLISFEDLLRGTQESVDGKLKPDEDQFISKISGIKPIVNARTGKVTTAQQVMDALLGKPSPVKIVKGRPSSAGYQGGSGIQLYDQGSADQYFVDGERVDNTQFAGAGSNFRLYVNNIKNLMNEKDVAIKKKRNELMQRETVLQREAYNFATLNSNNLHDPQKGETPGFKETLAGVIKLPLKHIDDLTIGETDLAGRIIVTLNDSRAAVDKLYDRKMVLNNLKRYGGRDNKVLDNGSVVLEGINELSVINENDMSSMMKPYVRTLEQQATATKSASTTFIRSIANNTSYRLDISKSFDGGYDYRIFDQNKRSPVYSSDNRDKALAWFQTLTQQKLGDITIPK